MAKQILTDNSGAWFDDEKAIRFPESSVHDGNNYISRATGSQWEHQQLFFTKSGNWVLNHWSNCQGTTETYERIDEAAAIRWLICQGRWEEKQIKELPQKVQQRIKEGVTQSEI